MDDVGRIVLLCTAALAAAVPVGAAAVVSIELRDRMLCPAELLVIQADARKYYRTHRDAPVSRGLRNRITAALSTLPLLCRRHAAATSMDSEAGADFVDRVRQLREPFDSGRQDLFLSRLAGLTAKTPFEVTPFLFDRQGNGDEDQAGGIYRRYCHGCHTAPASDTENPALPLHDMASELPQDELFARMLLGVRGTPDIGLANPLTPLEIGAMVRFLEVTDADGQGPATPGDM